MNEKYWQQVYERYEHPTVPCVGDLEKIAQRNPVVRAFLASWKSGALTFEQMACGLVCELATQNERFHELGVSHFLSNTPPAVVTEEPPK